MNQVRSKKANRRIPNRRLLALALGAAAALGVAAFWLVFHPTLPWAANDTSRLPSGAPQSYRELGWDDLMPKEWDPTTRLGRHDGSLLSDLDPQAQKMLEDLRAIWDNAPTVNALDGATVKLPGYVVPLDEADGALVEFLLVPYFGACIHTPPPPANQIVYVIPDKPVKGFGAMDTVWVSGRMSALREDSPMGASGYRLEAQSVTRYRPPRP
ncbi:MAG TPA: DUF3299 domain-containing protein [Caldimonas sp.]